MTLKEKLLGSWILTVGKYKHRVKGLERGFDNAGVRLDCHHAPHDGTTIIPREDGTCLAIPEDVHSWLHKVRFKKAQKEDLHTQVENDFDMIRNLLRRRGYSDELIDESRELVHAKNRNKHYRDAVTGNLVEVHVYKDGSVK